MIELSHARRKYRLTRWLVSHTVADFTVDGSSRSGHALERQMKRQLRVFVADGKRSFLRMTNTNLPSRQ